MIAFDPLNHPNVPTILTPGQQRAAWFLGALSPAPFPDGGTR